MIVKGLDLQGVYVREISKMVQGKFWSSYAEYLIASAEIAPY